MFVLRPKKCPITSVQIAPGVPYQSWSQVCLHSQSQLQSLWLALLRQLRIFLQAVDTALCQEVRWPKKKIKLHVAQGQPVSADLWMTSSYSFFKKFSGSPLDDQPLPLLQENSVVRVEFPLDGTPLSYHPTVPAPSTLKVDITLQIVPST